MKKYTLMVRGRVFQHMIQFDSKDKAERVMNWVIWKYAKIMNNETLQTEAIRKEP